MSRFFIERPIFAGVISILFVLAGLIAAKVLPIAQYPEIAPPTVTITANYPGASAEVRGDDGHHGFAHYFRKKTVYVNYSGAATAALMPYGR